MQPVIEHYLAGIRRGLSAVDPAALTAVAELFWTAYVEERQVFTLGNGASAALASHVACDLGKGLALDVGQGPARSATKRLRVISLVDNAALLTAYGNDIAYEDVFVEQLKNLLRPRDVVLGITGSGSSPNVVRALAYARQRGAVTVGFTSVRSTAAQVCAHCELALCASPTVMEQIEDVHVVFHHAISLALRARIAELSPTV